MIEVQENRTIDYERDVLPILKRELKKEGLVYWEDNKFFGYHFNRISPPLPLWLKLIGGDLFFAEMPVATLDRFQKNDKDKPAVLPIKVTDTKYLPHIMRVAEVVENSVRGLEARVIQNFPIVA